MGHGDQVVSLVTGLVAVSHSGIEVPAASPAWTYTDLSVHVRWLLWVMDLALHYQPVIVMFVLIIKEQADFLSLFFVTK